MLLSLALFLSLRRIPVCEKSRAHATSAALFQDTQRLFCLKYILICLAVRDLTSFSSFQFMSGRVLRSASLFTGASQRLDRTGHKMLSVPFVFSMSRFQGPAFSCDKIVVIVTLLEAIEGIPDKDCNFFGERQVGGYLERRIYERPLTCKSEPFIENQSDHISKLSLHQVGQKKKGERSLEGVWVPGKAGLLSTKAWLRGPLILFVIRWCNRNRTTK